MIGKRWMELMVMKRYDGNLQNIYIIGYKHKQKGHSSEEEEDEGGGDVDVGAADEMV